MNILETIIAAKKEEVKRLRSEYRYSDFSESEFFNQDKLSLSRALTKNRSLAIIAEIKKASPSAGLLKENFNPMQIAQTYLSHNVNAISVLTDQPFFQGHISYLKDIARIKRVPLLRKDFIIDTYQVYQAKAYGADAVLLIAEVLSKNQIQELTQAAKEVDLETLLELHSLEQLNKINFKSNPIIGINNRNLDDFSVNIFTTLEVAKTIPDATIVVSESGIHTQEDIDLLKKSSTRAILVGEHLMRTGNLDHALEELKRWCAYAR
jgi:indole-3-glycerol phosphate synthase